MNNTSNDLLTTDQVITGVIQESLEFWAYSVTEMPMIRFFRFIGYRHKSKLSSR